MTLCAFTFIFATQKYFKTSSSSSFLIYFMTEDSDNKSNFVDEPDCGFHIRRRPIQFFPDGGVHGPESRYCLVVKVYFMTKYLN